MIIKLSVKHFKSIFDLSFEPGMVNVLVGANGSGKSSLLEAIGVLSAAIDERVDDSSLYYRGVRLGTPSLYKSSFKNQNIPLTIELGVKWKNKEGNWDYSVNLNNPIEKPLPSWEYHSERLDLNHNSVFGRSRATKLQNFDIEINKFKGLFSFSQGVGAVRKAEDLYSTFRDYAIYTPSTQILRGVMPDPSQREPIGLQGGRLSEVVNELLRFDSEQFGSMDIDELLELIDWVNNVSVGRPTKDMLAPSVPSTQKVIRFKDRYMKEGRNELTPYDASEGSLYVLFVLSIAMHPSAPGMFSIDNFDQAMNPRLARKVASIFCQQVIKNKKIAFLTTHNPYVLDGLNLRDERIRLFALDRDFNGHARIKRIVITDKLLAMGKEGYSLSRLWVMGRLGGVPNL